MSIGVWAEFYKNGEFVKKCSPGTVSYGADAQTAFKECVRRMFDGYDSPEWRERAEKWPHNFIRLEEFDEIRMEWCGENLSATVKANVCCPKCHFFQFENLNKGDDKTGWRCENCYNANEVYKGVSIQNYLQDRTDVRYVDRGPRGIVN